VGLKTGLIMTGCNSEPPARDRTFHYAAPSKHARKPSFLDSFGPLEFRQNHSRRTGGHGSHSITVHICSCHSVTHLEMCSFLHGSTLSRCLRYRLGLLAVGPKLGEKKWRLQTPRSVHTSFVCADAIESFRGGATQSSQLVRVKAEQIHHGTTAEKRITAALRRTRVY
jgi:hypothetical protein